MEKQEKYFDTVKSIFAMIEVNRIYLPRNQEIFKTSIHKLSVFLHLRTAYQQLHLLIYLFFLHIVVFSVLLLYNSIHGWFKILDEEILIMNTGFNEENSNLKRVAIVTGGTRGMGVAISKSLVESGINVLAVYRSNKEEADKLVSQLTKAPAQIETFQADVGIKTDAERVVKYAGEKWGKVDILVNNAGIFDFAFLEEMTETLFDKTITTNLKSMIFMTQAVIPWMKKNHFGRIVNATSISGTLADVGLVAYACSKAGVNLLTKISSGELAPYGITVNAYAPGIIHTDMTDEMIKERGDLQLLQIPAGYFGTSEEVASLVKFLCSEQSSYITGEIIGVDGGMMKVQNPQRAYEFVKEFNKDK